MAHVAGLRNTGRAYRFSGRRNRGIIVAGAGPGQRGTHAGDAFSAGTTLVWRRLRPFRITSGRSRRQAWAPGRAILCPWPCPIPLPAPATCWRAHIHSSCRPTAASKSPSPAAPTPASPARSTPSASRTRWPASPRRRAAPSSWSSSTVTPTGTPATEGQLPGRPARLRLRQGAAGPAGALAGVPRRLLRIAPGPAGPGRGDGHPPSAEGLRPADARLCRQPRPARARAADQGRQARPRRSRRNTLQAVRMELSSAFGDTVSVQTFSGESKQGVDEARAVVGSWLEA